MNGKCREDHIDSLPFIMTFETWHRGVWVIEKLREPLPLCTIADSDKDLDEEDSGRDGEGEDKHEEGSLLTGSNIKEALKDNNKQEESARSDSDSSYNGK